jgi:hypothetical protein
MKVLLTVISMFFILLAFSTSSIMAQSHVDPPFLQIQSAENAITLDGQLTENDWQRRFDFLIYDVRMTVGDVEYAVTDCLLVHSQIPGFYWDTTTTLVKMLHYGTDLYFAISSNDKYVNKWGGSWEGDGLFMKVWTKSGETKEFKLYFNASGIDPDMVYEEQQAGSGQGMGYKLPGTVVNDTSQIDAGYTAELIVHLDQLGYTAADNEVMVMMNIFDPDYQTGTAGEEWNIGSYHKMWWGSEWGPVNRVLRLADPPRKIAITTSETFTLDGQLNEAFWANADQVTIGKGSHTSSGGWYMQWGKYPANTYTDQSMATVKFAHNGTDLYLGVESDDASVCKWSPGWEADGLFLWMTFKGMIPAPGQRMEIKNMYFNSTQGAGAVFEVNANVPTGGAEGASYEPAGTITHTETNGPDAGYSLEVVVHTDLFGYADGDTVKLSTVIWDMDYASTDVFNDSSLSDYAPNWWGTQWVDSNFEKFYMYREVILSSQTGIEDTEMGITTNYRLEQNYPNPFNPSTSIQYYIPSTSDVKIEVYNLLGSKITSLFEGKQSAGSHTLSWNGKDQSGNPVASGIYFYKLSTPHFSETKKMMLMK